MKPFFCSLSYLAALLVGTMSAYAATPITTKNIPLNPDVPPIDFAITPDGHEIYVSMSNGRVAVINTNSNKVTSTLNTDSSIVGSQTGRTIVSSLDGSEIYTAASDPSSNDPQIKVINTSTKAISTINIPSGQQASAIAMNPNGSALYTVDTGSALMAINTTTKAVTSIDTTKHDLTSILFSPDGTKAYILNAPDEEKGVVCVIDTALNTLTTTIEVGINDRSNLWYIPMAISSDGSRLYVLNAPGHRNESTKGSVYIIDTGSNDVIDTIEVGLSPSAIAAIPNQPKVYAVNFPDAYICSVSVIDTSSGDVTDEVAIGIGSNFIELTPDGSIAYVSNSNSSYISDSSANSVSVIDTNADVVLYTVQTEADPSPIVLTPDGATVYVLNLTGNSVTTFNTPATSHASNLGTFFLLRSAQGLTNTEFFANLAWDTSPGAISYEIYRDGALIATLPASTTEYRDHNLDPNRTYTYTLDAVTDHGTIHYDFWQDPNP